MDNSRKFFSNYACDYYPCHGIEDQNCLFCYCPLYSLGEECGGNFKYTSRGIKDCSACKYPHLAENYDEMISRLGNK